ncbi:alpha/beta fold hydrolase [Glycomyces salinus]|uniref:alpha/beta fold hydrolase n=1 Tax=Glycomyces salinus TaxID=980294 RepID=UPI0018ED8A09|nr:alpha/beta hydrolase [Glycomyces salinus]
MGFVRAAGTDFGYDRAGRGPTIVLIHGDLADRRLWDEQFAALAVDHDVIRYDRRGWGATASGTGEFSHRDDLLALLDALGVERAVLAGNSMGGGHAVAAALKAPERVTGLVLVSAGLPGHRWPQSFLEQARARMLGTVPEERMSRYRAGEGAQVDELEDDLDAYVKAHLRWMVAGPDRTEFDLPAAAWDRAVEMFRDHVRRSWTGPSAAERAPDPAPEPHLDRIDAPTLVVNGLADVPEVQAVSDLLSSRIPGAERVDLSHTGHAAPLERPLELTARLRQFLDARVPRQA